MDQFIEEEIRKGNKDRRLTLDEMYNIFMGDAYKEFRDKTHLNVMTDNNGRKYVEYIIGWFNNDVSPLLYQHIAAEQLLQAPDYRKINWRKALIGNSFAIIKLLDLCMNPLVWVNAAKFNEIVIEGRVAEEDYDATRYLEKHELFGFIYNQEVLRFADELPSSFEDSLELGYTKGMHFWDCITQDDSEHYRNVLNGAQADFKEWQKAKAYNLGRLRDNLTLIANKRGGSRAAMILHMLQDEWPKIKLWKTHLENMTEDDIRYFETGLFHGFDDLLEEWEKDKVEEEKKPSAGKPDSSFFAVSERMTYEMCEKELIRVINKAKSKANACREILRSETVGYFVLSDKTDQEKADAINPWVAFTNKKYVFTGDDFCKARNS